MTSPLLWSSSCDPNIKLLVAVDPLKITDLYYIIINSNRYHNFFFARSSSFCDTHTRACVHAHIHH